MFWGEFWPQLIATLIGLCLSIPITLIATFLAVLGALLLDRRQENLKRLEDKQEEENRKHRILVTLRKSLIISKQSVKRWQSDLQSKDEKKSELDYIIPSDETWVAFREGGELAWINDPELLFTLSGAFSWIRHIKFVNETLYGKFISSTYEDYEKSLWYKGQLHDLLENMCETALETLDDTLNIIDAELSK